MNNYGDNTNKDKCLFYIDLALMANKYGRLKYISIKLMICFMILGNLLGIIGGIIWLATNTNNIYIQSSLWGFLLWIPFLFIFQSLDLKESYYELKILELDT